MTDDGFYFYMGKFVTVYCDDGRTFCGTLLNIDRFGNADIIANTNGERIKITIARTHLVGISSILEKII